ncbi:MAG: response regulator, partial [Oligoflexales bacterium]|nr:response regulator [Oligoflexales bacterium]
VYYVLYISGFFICQSTLTGFAFQYLWPDHPGITSSVFIFSLGFTLFWLSIYTMSYLGTSAIAPKFHKLLILFTAFCVILMGVSFLLPYRITVVWGASIVITIMPYLALLGCYCLYKGEKIARIYVAAFIWAFFGSFLASSRMFGIIPSNFITLYGLQIGSTVEMVLLSLAVGYKIRLEQKKLHEAINEDLEAKIRDKTNALVLANTQLKELDKQKTTFFQNVSHELRTPLTLILNPLEKMIKDFPDNRDVQMINQNSMRLLRLVNQLLDFQKLSSGKMEIKLEPINIVSFLRSVSEYFIPTCISKNIRFFFDLEKVEEAFILGQIDALEKIIFNYLSNAIKHTKEEGTIELSLKRIDGNFRIAVMDEGPGISEKDQRRLFTVFHQTEKASKSEMDGTGLGLALVKELSQALHGKVFVESSIGKGSTFGVIFPVHSPNEVTFDLLIMDDDEKYVSQTRNFLLEKGLRIDVATSISDARLFTASKAYCCILSDTKVKGEDALSLLSEISTKDSEINILMASAKCSQSDLNIIFETIKARKIYTKPIHLDELLADIMILIGDNKKLPKSSAELKNYHPRTWHLGEETTTIQSDEDEEIISGDGRLVLVVDDMKDMRDLITRILKSRGFRFATARNGIEGLKKAAELKPDLAIIDWMMPKLTGIEMIEKMLQNENLKTIPTILLTAKSDEESKTQGIKKGAHAYLGKPFDQLELFSLIENLIHLKEGEEKIRQLNRELTEKVLKRFLPHKLVDDISSGNKILDDKPKLMEVTILFSDLSGFTERSEEVGAHLISTILNTYFDRMTRIIFEYGGTIDKFLGDGIMVIFGAPEESSSAVQVEKAINCALAMQSALRELNSDWEKMDIKEFSMRIGIHKGSGIVGSFGGEMRSEYTVIGPVVNMASRIEKSAAPGEILFSSVIRDNLTSNNWSKAGSFTLKGIGEISLFKLETADEVPDGDTSKTTIGGRKAA